MAARRADPIDDFTVPARLFFKDGRAAFGGWDKQDYLRLLCYFRKFFVFYGLTKDFAENGRLLRVWRSFDAPRTKSQISLASP